MVAFQFESDESIKMVAWWAIAFEMDICNIDSVRIEWQAYGARKKTNNNTNSISPRNAPIWRNWKLHFPIIESHSTMVCSASKFTRFDYLLDCDFHSICPKIHKIEFIFVFGQCVLLHFCVISLIVWSFSSSHHSITLIQSIIINIENVCV